MIECPACAGRGFVDGEDSPKVCKACSGNGEVRQRRRIKRKQGRDEYPARQVSIKKRIVTFDSAPHIERNPAKLSEKMIREIELSHGWTVKRPSWPDFPNFLFP